MMRTIRLAPNRNLQIGSALAKSVSDTATAAANAFTQAKYHAQMMKLQQQRYQVQMENARAMGDYRRAMGQAALRKTGGTEITPEFLATAQALGIRPDYLGQFAGAGAPSPGGSGMTQQRYLDQKVNGDAPALPGSSSPMGLPTNGPGSPGPAPGQPSQAAPAAPPAPVNLSYGQRQLLEKMGSSQAMAQRGIPGATASMYGADQRMQSVREGLLSKQEIEQMKAQMQADHDARMGEINKTLQTMKNQGSATTARIRSSGHPGAGNTAADKAGLAQLNGINKQLQDAQKVMQNPTHGIEGVVLTPDQISQRQGAAKAQYDNLTQQRETLFQQYPQLRGAGMKGSGSPSSQGAAAPAAPAGSPSPGVGPLRIYQPADAHQAPAGALIQLPNGNIHKVLEAHPGGDPTISSQPVQMAPPAAPAQPQSIPVAVPGQGAPPQPPAALSQPEWGQ